MNHEIIDTDNERTYVFFDDMVSSKIIPLEEEINTFVRSDDRDVIFDLNNVTRLDSMSIAAVIRMKNKLSEDNRNLQLINPGESIIKVLELAGLDSFLLD